jgi:hypothetical protein
MTIDSTWLTSFKEDHPHAFTRKNPFAPAAVFVDGQIRLMQGPPAQPQTWDDFIFRQFVRPLQKFFDVSAVVILAFDNYEHVPRAKCMTQAKRRRHTPVLPFTEASELPCMVPEGERWTQSIANRVFKTRVIDLVLLRLPMLLLQHQVKRRLIVDYHQPVEYRFCQKENRVETRVLEDLPVMGEADVKFTRFADRFGKLMVDSIDGDSIPIALMHHELRLRQAVPPPMVSILRLELRVPSLEPKETTKKRDSEGVEKRVLEPMETAKKRDSEGVKKRPPRTYEYVNVHALFEGLKTAIAQSMGRVKIPTHEGHEIAMLVGLIALTGTDFTRNLPQLSGRSVYSWLPDIWPTLAVSYHPGLRCLVQEKAVDQLVSLLYRIKFPKHAHAPDFSGVLEDLQRSSIAGRTKDSLPSVERVACTVRNANWVLAYWTCEPAPDPIQPQFGFRLLPGGSPGYDD